MKRWIAISAFLMAMVAICTAAGREQRLKENETQLKKSPSNPSLLEECGFLSLNLGRYKEAVAYGDRLMRVSKTSTDSILLRAQAHIIKGQAYSNLSLMREAFDNLEKGRILAEKIGDHDLLSSAYNGLGIYYTQGRGNPEQGIINYNHALVHADSAGNETKQAIALYNLGGLWLYRDKPEGKRYALESFKKASAIGDYELAFHNCVILNGFAIVEKNSEEAEEWLDKASGLLDKIGTKGGETYLNVFGAQTAQLAGDKVKADRLFCSSLNNISDLTPAMRTNLCTQYGRFLIDQKRVREGIKVLEQGLLEAASTKVAVDSIPLIRYLADAYHMAGEDDHAFQLMTLHSELCEKSRKREEDQSYMEYSVRNDMRLNELLIERQRSQMLAKEKTLILVLGICSILAVSCGLLFYFYQRKSRLFKSIVAQNRSTIERERVLREHLEDRSQISGTDQRSGTGSEEGLNRLADRFALMMIEQRWYENPDLTINSTADLLDTNRTYLSKAINRATGRSFSEIITEYRVRRAMEILSDPTDNCPLKAVAGKVGFNSMSAFYAAFKNQVGMTPNQYRKNAVGMSK